MKLNIKEPIKNVWYKMPGSFKSMVYDLGKWRPMEYVMDEVQNRGINIGILNALEVFGKSGEWHTLDYAYKVSSLDIIEIDPSFEKDLKRNFPMASVRIGDSYKEIKNYDKKFSLIVVDNPMSNYGENYCEHFKLFPDIFNICADSTVMILNVIPEVDDKGKAEYPYLLNAKQLECRREFYNTDHPEKLTLEEIADTYRKLSLKNGFNMEWNFFKQRSIMYYFVCLINKINYN